MTDSFDRELENIVESALARQSEESRREHEAAALQDLWVWAALIVAAAVRFRLPVAMLPLVLAFGGMAYLLGRSGVVVGPFTLNVRLKSDAARRRLTTEEKLALAAGFLAQEPIRHSDAIQQQILATQARYSEATAKAASIEEEIRDELRGDLSSSLRASLEERRTRCLAAIDLYREKTDLLKEAAAQVRNAVEPVRLIAERTARLRRLDEAISELPMAGADDALVAQDFSELRTACEQATGRLQELEREMEARALARQELADLD